MSQSRYILGISAYYHDSAAALICDGKVIAAAQEERFTRLKHDPSFPLHAVRYVLDEAGIELEDVDSVVFYDKPLIKFERLLETYHGFAPKGLFSFVKALPVWIKEKVFMRNLIQRELKKISKTIPKLLFSEHHLSHGASAFYPSPFKEAVILTLDGVGEWSTLTVADGQDHSIRLLKELHFPHSLGLLYSAFTYYCGFRVNSGEYKLMGLAPYGNPESEQVKKCVAKIKESLVDIRQDGSFLLNMKYFEYATGSQMCNDKAWQELFGLEKRDSESPLSQEHMNLALACQLVTEEIILKLATTAKKLTGRKNLVMAGGVALNCVANGKLEKSGLFDNIWVQPAAGDAGGALGAALAAHHIVYDQPRIIEDDKDQMSGAYLGPSFGGDAIKKVLKKMQAPATHYESFAKLTQTVAKEISQGSVVGWFQGSMEFGPRALGNRSILGDPRNKEMQKKLNMKIKYREGFRPFAPSVLEEDISDFFDFKGTSPYMLFVAPVKKSLHQPEPEGYQDLPLYERLYHTRSELPAITHVDYSARLQSVNKETNPRY